LILTAFRQGGEHSQDQHIFINTSAGIDDQSARTPTLLDTNPSLTYDTNPCVYSGMAPFCDGKCYSDKWTIVKRGCCIAEPGRSSTACWTGEKVKCCAELDPYDCFWDGTPPFCFGSCDGKTHWPHYFDSKGDGEECETGFKAKCCRLR